MKKIILGLGFRIYLLGHPFEHADPGLQPVDLLVEVPVHRVDPQLDFVRVRRVPGSEWPGAVHRVRHRARRANGDDVQIAARDSGLI